MFCFQCQETANLQDLLIFVIKGKGVIAIGAEEQEVSKDTLVENPRDIVHCGT